MRKGNFFDRGKRVIGVLLILVSVAALFTWEKWGKNRFLYEDILVLSENVEKGTVITEEMLTTVKQDTGEKDHLKAPEAGEIIGKEAAFFVHKGVPLFREYFAEGVLQADRANEQYILSVPDSWLLSSPETLARGDTVYFYFGEKLVTSAPVFHVGEEKKAYEVVVSSKQAAAISNLVQQGNKLIITYN